MRPLVGVRRGLHLASAAMQRRRTAALAIRERRMLHIAIRMLAAPVHRMERLDPEGVPLPGDRAAAGHSLVLTNHGMPFCCTSEIADGGEGPERHAWLAGSLEAARLCNGRPAARNRKPSAGAADDAGSFYTREIRLTETQDAAPSQGRRQARRKNTEGGRTRREPPPAHFLQAAAGPGNQAGPVAGTVRPR